MNMSNSDELVLVDGSVYIFRAYYALPPMHSSDGLPVNAVFGFCNMLLKLIEDIQIEFVIGMTYNNNEFLLSWGKNDAEALQMYLKREYPRATNYYE